MSCNVLEASVVRKILILIFSDILSNTINRNGTQMDHCEREKNLQGY